MNIERGKAICECIKILKQYREQKWTNESLAGRYVTTALKEAESLMQTLLLKDVVVAALRAADDSFREAHHDGKD